MSSSLIVQKIWFLTMIYFSWQINDKILLNGSVALIDETFNVYNMQQKGGSYSDLNDYDQFRNMISGPTNGIAVGLVQLTK